MQIDTKEQSSKFLPNKGWQIRQLNSKPEALQYWNHWAWENSCCKQHFLQGCEALPLPTLCSPRKQQCHKCLSILRDFTARFSPWAAFYQTQGVTGWEKGWKSLPTAESLAGWASLAVPEWMGSSKNPGEVDLCRVWGWVWTGAAEQGELCTRSRNGNRDAICCSQGE